MTPPTRYALVPVDPDKPMIAAGVDGNPTAWTDETDRGFPESVANDVYRSMLAASPNGGTVTAADLERAARAHALNRRRRLGGQSFPVEMGDLEDMSAALRILGIPIQPGATIGLTVAGAQPAGRVDMPRELKFDIVVSPIADTGDADLPGYLIDPSTGKHVALVFEAYRDGFDYEAFGKALATAYNATPPGGDLPKPAPRPAPFGPVGSGHR